MVLKVFEKHKDNNYVELEQLDYNNLLINTLEKLVSVSIAQTKQSLNALSQNIENIGEYKTRVFNNEQVWNWIDFLYFSTITQTTVGYGDVLPNRSVVRIIVIGAKLAKVLSGAI